ncbi:hypothetical protein SAMN05444166_8363 [Singulisphaera sp. GP187]|uniref:hypothetical protein n=1 Tax=Singulisphaera sp. GP187 TaxID=1882752 RepID=UPI000929636D|nr:hypothetical protein [Singulisphaera sp. GP187]SIO67438.1 hypothetical protein SAMN05444166_8363 [Singulisphaera sp. GP187]
MVAVGILGWFIWLVSHHVRVVHLNNFHAEMAYRPAAMQNGIVNKTWHEAMYQMYHAEIFRSEGWLALSIYPALSLIAIAIVGRLLNRLRGSASILETNQ